MKNKFEDYFENLEGQAWKLSEREKKKIIGAKPEARWLHTTTKNGGCTKTIQNQPQKQSFCIQTPLHTLSK